MSSVEGTGEVTLAILKDGVHVEGAEAGDTVEALFDRTPFYAESGGQAGDQGVVEWSGGRGAVLDTQKLAGRACTPTRAEDHRRPAWPTETAPTSRSTPRAAPAPGPTTPPPTSFTRPCAMCWAPTWPRRARWSTATVCASTSATAAR